MDAGSSSEKELGRYTLGPFLRHEAAGCVEKIFVTHADSDHTSGILWLLEEGGAQVRDLYLPCPAEGDEAYDRLRTAAEAAGARIRYLGAGDAVPLPRGNIRCLFPEKDSAPADRNDQSLVLLYEMGDFRALLTGDASSEAEHRVAENCGPGPVTVLKCGHHGSRTSTGEELLSAARPLYAILSYGAGNPYGHPHAETTERLERFGCIRLDTARCGAVTFLTDGRRLEERTWITDEDSERGSEER